MSKDAAENRFKLVYTGQESCCLCALLASYHIALYFGCTSSADLVLERHRSTPLTLCISADVHKCSLLGLQRDRTVVKCLERNALLPGHSVTRPTPGTDQRLLFCFGRNRGACGLVTKPN